jgi:protein-tyrosine kinase
MSRIRYAIQRIGAEGKTTLETSRLAKHAPETMDRIKSNDSKASDQALQTVPEIEQGLSLNDFERCLALPAVPNMGRIHQSSLALGVDGQATPETTRAETIDSPRSCMSKPSSQELPITPKRKQLLPKISTQQHFSSRNVVLDPDPRLVALVSPTAIVSEQYRTLRAKILQIQREKGLKTLLVTSTGMAEGKTLTAINLALTMSQEIDLKVLIVDCDLRRPAVHRCLGIPQDLGISDYLSQKCSLESIISETSLRSFAVTTAGTVSEKPAELLNSSRMDEFLGYAAQTFDAVIVDSPPVVALADADVLASKVDGVLFVVRALQTPTSLFQRSMESLRAKNVLGIVFNGDEDQETSKYSAYYRYEKRD